MSKENLVVIFDFDGVIADSITALYNVYLDFLLQFGHTGTPAEFETLNGPKLSEVVAYLKKHYRLSPSKKELETNYLEKVAKIYSSITLNPHIDNVLKSLKEENIPVALASASKKHEIMSVLNRYQLGSYFEHIVTGDDVSKAKPDPEIYNKVKSHFGEKHYIVIEDSYNGIRAANAAGMTTIRYLKDGTSTRDTTSSANIIISNFKMLAPILSDLEHNCITAAITNTISLELIEHSEHYSTEQLVEIESIWNAAQKTLAHSHSPSDSSNPAQAPTTTLTDGKIISYKSHILSGTQLIIQCYISSYKYFYAQNKAPHLNLGITPIGVSGVIIDDTGQSLIAQRHNVTLYDGFNEFVPSGTIDPPKGDTTSIEYTQHLTMEFEEETHMNTEIIKNIEPFGFIYDVTHNCYDICCKIHIEGDLKTHVKESYKEEYDHFQIENLQFIQKHFDPQKTVPTSILMAKILT